MLGTRALRTSVELPNRTAGVMLKVIVDFFVVRLLEDDPGSFVIVNMLISYDRVVEAHDPAPAVVDRFPFPLSLGGCAGNFVRRSSRLNLLITVR